MAYLNSDVEILPKLEEHSKKLMKLEEYMSFVIENTQYWHENKYMVKNEIRETFSALSSMLHHREMELYRQVDELHVGLGSSAVNVSHKAGLQQGKNSSKSSRMQKKLLCGSSISPPVKLKFQSDVRSLEEVIHSFGCLDIEDGGSSDENNFTIINSVESDLNAKAEHLSLGTKNVGDQDDTGNNADLFSFGSSSCSDSFEILPDSEASVSWSRRSPTVEDLSTDRNDFEQSDAQSKTSASSASSNLLSSPGIVPDNSDFTSWLKENTNHGTSSNSSCSVNVESSVRSIGRSYDIVSCSIVPNENAQWLRKQVGSELSPATVLAKDLASMFPFTDTVKAKENHVHLKNLGDLRRHSEPTEISHNSSNATYDSIVKSGAQNPTVNVKSSDSVPDFLKKVSRNEESLVREHPIISQLLCTADVKETDIVKEQNVAQKDRIPFQTETPSAHVSKDSLVSTISKMFIPYFQNQDKNNWLANKCMDNRKNVCS